MTSKIPGVTDVGLKPRHLSKVAVVGGGSMGSGIATALLLANMHVVLKEVNTEFLSKGIQSVEGNIKALVTDGELVQDKAEKALSLLKGVLDYSEFEDVDMVIEAVVENIQLKQTIFCELEKACPRHCILATTTSTIDLNTVGQYTSSMERIIGAHTFSPAHIMPLVEIVRTEKTSPQVVLDLVNVGKIIKKVPAVVYDGTRFVNRIFSPYCGSARTLAAVLGVDIFWIDKVINDFGLPIGSFQLEDLAGYGVEFVLEFDGSWKNNERSYYTYENGSKPRPNLSMIPIFEEFISMANFRPRRELVDVSDKDIVEMVLFPVVNEACRVLDEGIVIRASDLDVASVHGMGFPSYRGGIVFWADTVGPSHIYRSLLKWTQQYGDFYKPSRYLEERASEGLSLSAPASTLSASKSRL